MQTFRLRLLSSFDAWPRSTAWSDLTSPFRVLRASSAALIYKENKLLIVWLLRLLWLRTSKMCWSVRSQNWRSLSINPNWRQPKRTLKTSKGLLKCRRSKISSTLWVAYSLLFKSKTSSSFDCWRKETGRLTGTVLIKFKLISKSYHSKTKRSQRSWHSNSSTSVICSTSRPARCSSCRQNSHQ